MYQRGDGYEELGRESEDWDDFSELSDAFSWEDVTTDDSWDDLPDPWTGDLNIEYWRWDGVRLIPMSPADRARIQEDERTEAARWRLKDLQERERREARSLRRRLSTVKTWWEAHVSVHMRVDGPVQRLRGWFLPRAARRTEEARAERPSTKH